MELKITPWMGEMPATAEKIRQLLNEQELRVNEWSHEPNDILPSHTHGYHKILYIVAGDVRFEFPTVNLNLNVKQGDRLDLPAGIRHNGIVGTKGVSCLEAHVL